MVHKNETKNEDQNEQRADERSDDENYLRRKAVRKTESSNFCWYKILLCYSTSIIGLALVFLRGGKGMNSILGIHKCGRGDILVSLLFLITCLFLAYLSFLIIVGEQKLKELGGWKFAKDEFVLSKKIAIKLSIVALITGFIGSIVGIGGNMIISPILLDLGMAP